MLLLRWPECSAAAHVTQANVARRQNDAGQAATAAAHHPNDRLRTLQHITPLDSTQLPITLTVPVTRNARVPRGDAIHCSEDDYAAADQCSLAMSWASELNSRSNGQIDV